MYGGFWMSGLDLPLQCVDTRCKRSERDTWSEPRNGQELVISESVQEGSRRLMSHRRPDLVGAAPKRSGINERGRQDADNRIRFGIERDRLPCDGRVRRITALPKVCGYDGRGRRAWPVVVGCEFSSHHRLHTEKRKEVVCA